jgi:hypothetical protein
MRCQFGDEEAGERHGAPFVFFGLFNSSRPPLTSVTACSMLSCRRGRSMSRTRRPASSDHRSPQ